MNYADLNLATSAGRDALSSRVRSAADHLCNSDGVEPLRLRMERANCFRTAVRSADAQVQQAIADFGTNRLASRGGIRVTLAR